MVQRPRQSHQYIREGEGKRVSFDNLYFRVGDRAKSSWKVGPTIRETNRGTFRMMRD